MTDDKKKIDFKDSHLIKLIEIEYCSESQNRFARTPANESIITPINILGDENNMSIPINNDIYIFGLR